MNSIDIVYREVSNLHKGSMLKLINERLDKVLRRYVMDLEEANASLIRNVEKKDLYKELSKSK